MRKPHSWIFSILRVFVTLQVCQTSGQKLKFDKMKLLNTSFLVWGFRNSVIRWREFSCRVAWAHTVYPKKYAHGFVVLCFIAVMQSFIMNSHEVFIHIHQGCFAGTGAIYNHNKAQQSKNRVHISWDILYNGNVAVEEQLIVNMNTK